MPTKAQTDWLRTFFGPRVAAGAPTGSAPPAVASPDAAGSAATHATAMHLPDAYTSYDLTQLDKDIANTRSAVQDALDLERAMRLGALQMKVDIDDPDAAAAQIRHSGLRLGDQDQVNLETRLDTLNSRAADLEQRFHAVEKAHEDLDAALVELANLPDKVPAKEGEEPWFTAGKHAEHVFDFINAVTAVIKTGVGVRDVVQAVLGSDAVKDRVEKLADRIAGVEENIDRTMIALNAAINTLTWAAAKRARDGGVQLARAVDDYRQELGLYGEARDSFTDLLTKTAAGLQAAGARKPADGGADARSIARVYGAVLVAGNAYRAATSALITDTLSEPRHQVWIDQLVPPGTLLLNLPDEGDPASPRMMTVQGDLIFYKKGDTNFAYRATRQKIEAYASPLGAVHRVHVFAPEVESILQAWTKAMKGVLD